MLLEGTERNRACSTLGPGPLTFFNNPFNGLLPGRYDLEDSAGFRSQRFRPPSRCPNGLLCKCSATSQRGQLTLLDGVRGVIQQLLSRRTRG